MKMFRTFFLVIALLALPDFSASAQSSAASAKPEGLSIRAISSDTSATATPATWAVIGPDGDAVPLQIILGSLSLPAVQKMGARIQVYDYAALRTALTSSSNKAAPPSLPAPLIDVPVPAGAQKCLLVVRTDTPGLKSQVFDESAQQFPGGSRLFINLTPYKLEGSCGVTGFEVAPQSSALVSPAVPADHRAIVKIFAQMPSRKAIVVDNTWAFFPNARGIVLIFEVPGGALRTLGLSDEIPPEIGRTAKGI